MLRDPFDGLGKPEPLRHSLAGMWSRRIDKENRLVYQAEDERVFFFAARYYSDLPDRPPTPFVHTLTKDDRLGSVGGRDGRHEPGGRANGLTPAALESLLSDES